MQFHQLSSNFLGDHGFNDLTIKNVFQRNEKRLVLKIKQQKAIQLPYVILKFVKFAGLKFWKIS